MDDAIDVTAVMLADSTLPNDVRKFKKRVLSFPLVKSCDIEITRVLAKPLGGRRYEMRLEGELKIVTKVLVTIALKGGGGGLMTADDRQLEIKDITFDRDNTGIIARVLSMSGYAVGRKVGVAKKDIDVLERTLGAAA